MNIRFSSFFLNQSQDFRRLYAQHQAQTVYEWTARRRRQCHDQRSIKLTTIRARAYTHKMVRFNHLWLFLSFFFKYVWVESKTRFTLSTCAAPMHDWVYFIFVSCKFIYRCTRSTTSTSSQNDNNDILRVRTCASNKNPNRNATESCVDVDYIRLFCRLFGFYQWNWAWNLTVVAAAVSIFLFFSFWCACDSSLLSIFVCYRWINFVVCVEFLSHHFDSMILSRCLCVGLHVIKILNNIHSLLAE